LAVNRQDRVRIANIAADCLTPYLCILFGQQPRRSQFQFSLIAIEAQAFSKRRWPIYSGMQPDSVDAMISQALSDLTA
jgi:hypothetical protein